MSEPPISAAAKSSAAASDIEDIKNENYEQIESLLDDSQKQKVLQYPKEDLDHWLSMRVGEFKFRRDKETPVEETLAYIFLPIPQGLATAYNQTWNNENVPLGLGKLIEDNQETGKIGNLFSTAVDALMTKEGAILAGAGLSKLLFGKAGIPGGVVSGGFVGGEALKYFNLMNNKAINTFESVSYEKPVLREHSFTWKLIARSKPESHSIRQIIKALKYFSSPSTDDGILLSYPQTFDIDFHYMKNLFNIGPSVLTSLAINYHAEGRPIYALEDGTSKAPISVEITTSFKEIAHVTKETINKFNR